MTGRDWAALVAAVFAGLYLSGVAGMAIYAATKTRPSPDTDWIGRALWWGGRGIIAAGLAIIAGMFFASGIAAVYLLVRG